MAATSTAARVPEAAQPVGDALPPRRRRRTPVWASQHALKVTMAITGTIMALFVVVHMVGNLKVLAGPQAFNGYAAWLRQVAYPLLPHEGLLWAMRLALGVGGALMLSLSYILSFSASLWAFGYTVPFAVLAITYLASNTVGSIVPSPGGIGPVELALTAGLVAAGVPYGVALSTAIVYRLVTFWIPIPVGWLSLQRLQKVGDL